MATANITVDLGQTVARFQQVNPQTRLAILYYLAKKIHQASQTTNPSAFLSQKVHTILKQLQQLPREDRQAALQEMLSGEPTRLTEAYEMLDTNMRMAFWYQIVNSRKGDAILLAANFEATDVLERSLLTDLESRDSNELVSLLREAVQSVPEA